VKAIRTKRGIAGMGKEFKWKWLVSTSDTGMDKTKTKKKAKSGALNAKRTLSGFPLHRILSYGRR
jgi:hypothetical protein